MREQLLALYELQRVDNEALEVERAARDIPEQIFRLEAATESSRAELGQLNANADTLRSRQRELESQISEESQKHQKWKRRLNDIHSPREYQAMSREIEIGERQVRGLEDDVLAVMAELEAGQKNIAEQTQSLKEQEASMRASIANLRKQEAEFRTEIAKIQERRPAILSRLEKRWARKYEQIGKYRNGVAIAVIKGGNCTGCQLKVRPQMMVEILRYETIEQCSSCQRLLVPEGLVQSATEEETSEASDKSEAEA